MGLRFIDWLKTSYKTKGEAEKSHNISDNTIRAYTSLLSNALNSAVRNDMLAENPFNRLSSDEKVKKRNPPENT